MGLNTLEISNPSSRVSVERWPTLPIFNGFVTGGRCEMEKMGLFHSCLGLPYVPKDVPCSGYCSHSQINGASVLHRGVCSFSPSHSMCTYLLNTLSRCCIIPFWSSAVTLQLILCLFTHVNRQMIDGLAGQCFDYLQPLVPDA